MLWHPVTRQQLSYVVILYEYLLEPLCDYYIQQWILYFCKTPGSLPLSIH